MILPIILLSNIAVINFSSDPCNYRCKQKEIENIVDIINGLVRCDSVIYTRLNNNMRSLEKLVPEEIVHNLHHDVFYQLIPFIKQQINTFLTPNFWDCKKNNTKNCGEFEKFFECRTYDIFDKFQYLDFYLAVHNQIYIYFNNFNKAILPYTKHNNNEISELYGKIIQGRNDLVDLVSMSHLFYLLHFDH